MDIFESEYLIRTLMHEYIKPNNYNYDWLPKIHENIYNGLCDYSNKLLLFNLHFIYNNQQENVRKLILHEIAHVLAGPKAKHDKWFQKKCKEIGLTDEQYIRTSL